MKFENCVKGLDVTVKDTVLVGKHNRTFDILDNRFRNAVIVDTDEHDNWNLTVLIRFNHNGQLSWGDHKDLKKRDMSQYCSYISLHYYRNTP